jgi:chloramphenicol 3-O phosphotransferase
MFSPRTPGKMIFLHGASSSGKSTIARELQDRIDEPFWHISIDHLRDSGVLPSVRFRRGDFDWATARGPFFDGYHRSLAAYLESGNNLILEHILETTDWQRELAALFARFDLFFVAVHCSLEELNRRELARGDRPAGSAAQDFETIHRGVHYDLELDTEDGAGGHAARVIAAWKSRRGPSRFFEVSA